MGDFTLGCLLGQYDGAQSFDVASTATPVTNIASWKVAAFNVGYQNTNVHSSGNALGVSLPGSSAIITFMWYLYNTSNDLMARYFPDVTTHQTALKFWGRLSTSPSSGLTGYGVGPGPYKPIGYSAELSPYYNSQTIVPSTVNSTLNGLYISRAYNAAVDTYTLYMDDVLSTVDPITLYPEWSFMEQSRLVQARHRTLGGKEHVYTWGKYFAYEVPLRFLSDSHAALINWWWSNQFHLLFTLDSSDSESSFIVRIANDRQPIGGRMRPYADLWQGVLQLESVHDGRLSY